MSPSGIFRNGPRRLLWAAAFLGLAVAAGPARTWAQTMDPGMVRIELERTDEVLRRATDILNQHGNPMALEALAFARQRQDQAWSEFRAGHPLVALQATRAAREAADRAIRMAQHQGDLEQMARRGVEDAERALENARACAGDSPSDLQRRMLDLAQQQLTQAHENLNSQHWEIARALVRQVMDTSRMLCAAGPMPGGPGPGGGPAGGPGGLCARVEQMADNVTRLYDRAVQDIPAGDAAARRSLDQARDLLEHGRESLRDGRCEPAFAQVRQSREVILQAMRSQDGEPDAAAVDRILEDTGDYLDSVAPGIPSGNAAAQALFDNATRHLQRARELRAAQSLRQAFAEARVARNLAWRASRVAGRGL